MRDAILFLANRLPWPVDDGWKRRTFHVLRALTRRGPVTLVTFHGGDLREADALRDAVPGALDVVSITPSRSTHALSVPLAMVTDTPFLAWRVRSARFTDAVRRLHAARAFALAIAGLTHLYRHLRVLPDDCTRVIDTHNIDSVVMGRYASNPDRNPAWRWYARRTAGQLRMQELRDFAHADAVWVCSEAEAAWIRTNVPAAKAHVVPNGVDTAAFSASEWKPPVAGRMVFFGRMDYHPNADGVAWFADAMLPAIRAARPDAELVVAGPGDIPGQRSLESRPGMRLLGAVPDVRPVVASASVVVVPLRSGGGTRLKILEALALGRPVITTTVGMEGLELVPGRDLLVADDAVGFAEAVTRVLSDPALAGRLGAAGKAAVTAYDWGAIETAIAALLDDPQIGRGGALPVSVPAVDPEPGRGAPPVPRSGRG